MLQKAYQAGQLEFFSDLKRLQDPGAFARYLNPVRQSEWVVYANPPFGGPQHVLEYLGRYTHRVAISNQRLVSMQDNQVSFRWKDYRHEHKQKHKIMTMPVTEFIRRFLNHALPPGYQRIRHYGLFANANRRQGLAVCRTLLLAPVSDLLPRPGLDFRDWYAALTGASLRRCPKCGVGKMIITDILVRGQRYVPVIPDSS